MQEIRKRWEKLQAYELTNHFKVTGESYEDFQRKKDEKRRRAVEREQYRKRLEQRRIEALKRPIYSENSSLGIRQRKVWKTLNLTEDLVRFHQVRVQSNIKLLLCWINLSNKNIFR